MNPTLVHLSNVEREKLKKSLNIIHLAGCVFVIIKHLKRFISISEAHVPLRQARIMYTKPLLFS